MLLASIDQVLSEVVLDWLERVPAVHMPVEGLVLEHLYARLVMA